MEVEAADDRVKLQMATKVQIFYTSYLTSITASLHTHERMPRRRKKWKVEITCGTVLQSSACSSSEVEMAACNATRSIRRYTSYLTWLI